MEVMQILSYATALVAILAIASAARQRDTINVWKGNSEALQEQVNIQKEEISTLKEETSKCAADHLISQGQIAELKAQLADFRDLPLKDIQNTQAEILGTQREIVKLLTTIKGNTQ